MKTTLIRGHQPSPSRRLRLPRVRLTPTRRGRRVRSAGLVLATQRIEPLAVVEPATTDNTPTESLHGDTLLLYLREIGQVKLLTPKEEITLARRIKRGDQKAREQMITANLRLVVKIAREYEGLGLPLLDLVNEGNIGLMKGVERFKTNKGAKFATYASLWIKLSIRRALSNHSKTIRLPVHVLEKMTRVRRAEVKLRETFDREPTDDELADELGIGAKRIRLYRDASRAPVALDSPISDENSTTVAEHVADANAVPPFEALLKNNDNELVKEVLATLDARESLILSMRFGLDNGREKTLEEVGNRLGVTRERIRQIQEQALQKMRVKIEQRDQPAPELAVALSFHS